MADRQALVTVVVALLSSGFFFSVLDYFKNRKKLPHEVDSIISATAGSMVSSMAVVNKTQEELIKELRDELAKHKVIIRHVARGLDNLGYPEVVEYSDELRTLLL